MIPVNFGIHAPFRRPQRGWNRWGWVAGVLTASLVLWLLTGLMIGMGVAAFSALLQ